jgi:hypothetical protein
MALKLRGSVNPIISSEAEKVSGLGFARPSPSTSLGANGSDLSLGALEFAAKRLPHSI